MAAPYSVLAPSCRIGAAALGEEPCQTRAHTTLGRQTQRSRPVLALGCCVGAVINAEPGHIHITP